MWGFDFVSVSLFFVGVLSLGYHATLRQGAQFGDDLSMIVLCGALLQPLYTARQSPLVARLITIAIAVTIVSFSVFYIQSGTILYHFLAFSTMITAIWPRTLYLIHFSSRPAEEKSRMMRQLGKVALIFIFAFGIWNVDLEKCYELRRLRKAVGLPWAWLLELHGWWHILTAIAAKDYIQLARELAI